MFTAEYCSFQTRTLDGQIVNFADDAGFLWSAVHMLLAKVAPLITCFVLLVICCRWRKMSMQVELTELLQQSIHYKHVQNRNNQVNGLPYERQGIQLNSEAISALIWKTFPALCVMILLCYIPAFIHNSLELNMEHYGHGDAWSLASIVCNILKTGCQSFKLVLYLLTSSTFCETTKILLLKKKWNILKKGCKIPKEESNKKPASNTLFFTDKNERVYCRI
jgi:hypothetical protein